MPTSVDERFERLRRLMIEQQLQSRGITDSGVLSAMAAIPREAFVPEEYRTDAYKDGPLPIGSNQTISQPYMVAIMTECLRLSAGDRVLEIGTGSGYQTAVLLEITPYVYTMERIPELARRAGKTLHGLGYATAQIKTGDGTLGWPEEAPFDAIIVTSGAPGILETLQAQLADGGRMAIPAGTRYAQTLFLMERNADTFNTTEKTGCVFVPLIGRYGWEDDGG